MINACKLIQIVYFDFMQFKSHSEGLITIAQLMLSGTTMTHLRICEPKLLPWPVRATHYSHIAPRGGGQKKMTVIVRVWTNEWGYCFAGEPPSKHHSFIYSPFVLFPSSLGGTTSCKDNIDLPSPCKVVSEPLPLFIQKILSTISILFKDACAFKQQK